ncbi:MAG TPA: hypothetical protein VKA10_04395, partial [Prolixibacteraceae bacterium]|nr:hypothetical protein [Prolixibacteraceae bacterium]
MKNENPYINEANFRRYLNNQMSDAERNRFERELEKNPFEAEALLGYEKSPTNEFNKEIEELKKEIRGKKRSSVSRYWAAAATVLLLVTAGLFWTQLNNETPTPEVAKLENGNGKKAVTAKVDSVTDENLASTSIKREAYEQEEVADIKNEVIETETKSATEPATATDTKNETATNTGTDNETVTASSTVTETESGSSEMIQEETINSNKNQTQLAGNSKMSRTKQDTKAASFNFGNEQSKGLKAGFTGQLSIKQDSIKLTERVAFPIDTNDIFPDSFKTIPASERERVQE